MKKTLLALALFTAANAHANLFVNGNFEEDLNGLATNNYAHYTTTATTTGNSLVTTVNNMTPAQQAAFGWASTTGSADPFIELSNSQTAQSGSNYAEINPNTTSAFSQTITGLAAGTYNFSWWDKNRDVCSGGSTGCVDNTYRVSVGGTFLNGGGASNEFTSGNAWAKQSFSLNLSGDVEFIFSDFGNLADKGVHLDTISLLATSVAAPVPEPETYAMFLAGLALLGFARRRQA